MTVILASMIFKPRSIICAPHGCAKVGTIGFCLGGRMVYLAACRTDADAHASYYGVGIETLLDEADQITAPTLIHIAAKDEFVLPQAQAKISDTLANHALAEVHIYDNQDHAFARRNGMHYDADATALAHGRTLPCLRRLYVKPYIDATGVRLGVHRVEKLVIVFGVFQFIDEEFRCIDCSHRIENTPQNIDFAKAPGSTSNSSLRVPDFIISMAGKTRLSEILRSNTISELPVPLNSSKITSSMRDPVSIKAVEIMVKEPPLQYSALRRKTVSDVVTHWRQHRRSTPYRSWGPPYYKRDPAG